MKVPIGGGKPGTDMVVRGVTLYVGSFCGDPAIWWDGWGAIVVRFSSQDSQKLPVGVLDSASSPHVVAPVERGSVESQLESGPDNRNGFSGQVIWMECDWEMSRKDC